ncbi:hypothetical protein [Pseudonocardia sp. GCM10023141]|uniref:hypothetical protein n=1 Tax=Pseudonocardia sp. GCM10023141 TaxID=3252653 RepID=UPI003606722F
MGWTGNPSTTDDNGHFAAAQESLAVSNDVQNRKAVRVVAGRCIDAADCAEMLAMLGLDAEQALSVR